MDAPHLWLNGRQITGRAGDRAPVLCPVELTWGSDSALDQPPPANLKFTVLFRDGMHDIPDFTNGAKIELIHPVNGTRVFAGQIRTMEAGPSEMVRGALEVHANATDYTADLEAEYLSTDWPEQANRSNVLRAAFNDIGWHLDMPTNVLQSAQAKYNSIKLLTLLDRHSNRYRGRRYDTSYRHANGEVVRRLAVMEGTARFIPADTLIALPNRWWSRTYNTPSIDGSPSPLIRLPASNVLLNPQWTQDPNSVVTAVQLSVMVQGDDGYTSQTERNFKAPAATVQKFGLRSVDVESDLATPADWPAAAQAWMNDDSPWQMSALNIRDSSELPEQSLRELLDQRTRYRALLTVTEILANRPDPGPSVMRSYIVGGKYSWTGKLWELELNLERTIYARPDYQMSYRDIRMSADPDIYLGTFDSIGDLLTFADFREIAGNPTAVLDETDQKRWIDFAPSATFQNINQTSQFGDYYYIRR